MRVAFSGSGLLFPVHLGAYLSIREHDKSELTAVSGTSGGSLVAAALAAFDLDTVVEIISNLSLGNAVSWNPTAAFKMGYSYGRSIEKDLKTIFKDMKFKDLRIPLHVTASDMVTGAPVVFSNHATPDMLIRTALRASIAVPILLTPVHYEDMILVDGSIFDAAPIRVFDTNVNEKTYGLRIRSKKRSKFVKQSYLLKLVTMLTSAVDHIYVDYDKLDIGSEVYILDVPYSTFESYDSKEMIETGNATMRRALLSQNQLTI